MHAPHTFVSASASRGSLTGVMLYTKSRNILASLELHGDAAACACASATGVMSSASC